MAVDHIKASGYTRIHDGTGLYYFCSTFLADSDPKRIPDYLRRSGVRDRESRQRLSRNIFEKYHLFDQADDLTEPS